jgi:hypothetical protein
LHVLSDETRRAQNSVVSHVIQEDWRIQFTHALNIPAVAFALSPSRSAAFKSSAREAKNVCNTARRITAIHQQKITVRNAGRERPVDTVHFIKPMVLTFVCGLYPDFEWDAKESLEFNYLDALGDSWPIVVPADNAIALLRVVAMRLEVARLKFKLDSDPLFAVANLPIGDAVWIGNANLLDSEL